MRLTPYSALARFYDSLNLSVDYESWADYLSKHFKKAAIPVKTVLDLACGTGTLSVCLSKLGFEVIGADLSDDMLCVAAQKAQSITNGPVFIRQDMTKLDLYGTVDAVVCCLDSVNYILKPEDLLKAFRRVRLFLNPGGVFIFDINTPYKLKCLDREFFFDESEDVFCAWRSFYSDKRRTATFIIDLFERRGGLWARHTEEHRERAYEVEEINSLLKQAEFNDVKIYGNLSMRAPKAQEDRIFFRCM